MRRQLCLKAVTAIQLSGKFLSGLITEGITDDNEDPTVIGLIQDWFYLGIEKLLLVSQGRKLSIAGFLSPGEKKTFADALTAAIGQAKRGR